jgi:hypothetical protein
MEVAPVSDHVVEIKEGMKVPFFCPQESRRFSIVLLTGWYAALAQPHINSKPFSPSHSLTRVSQAYPLN